MTDIVGAAISAGLMTDLLSGWTSHPYNDDKLIEISKNRPSSNASVK